MLDHFERGDEIEPALQRLDPADPIVDLQPLAERMLARRGDILGRRIDPGHPRSKPGQRLGEQAGAAADVRRPPPFERPQGAFVQPPMLINPVANVGEPHRVELVKHRR